MFNKEEYESETFEKIELTQSEVFDVHFYNCHFAHVNLNETVIKSCKFFDCTFENCNLSLVRPIDSEFSRVVFSNCNLMGVNWTEARWPIVGVHQLLSFDECNLNYSTFMGLKLHSTKMMNCSAKQADFREGSFIQSNFAGTELSESLFVHTDLSKCNFVDAKNYAIDLRLNKLEQCSFSLPEAVSLLTHSGVKIV